MSPQLDILHLRQWIGREDVAEDLLTPSLVARFDATLEGDGDLVQSGAIAPRLIHFCLCQPAVPMAALGSDGHPSRGGFLPPVPLPRRMWAGSEIIFHDELRVGGTVHRRSRITEVTAKTGRSGVLCLVTIEHEISTSGVLAISERQTIVYRDGPSVGPAVPAARLEPAAMGAVVETIGMSSTLLFRYSALTFNAHRIHYDKPYAMDTEGYPGLVVHGPLQASLLIQLAARCRGGRRPTSFAFRGVSPAFEGQQLGLHAGNVVDNGLELWTAPVGGSIAMQATARW